MAVLLGAAGLGLLARTALAATDSWTDVTDDAQLTGVDGRLLAFGDFNADRRTDLLVREGSSGARVYLATEATFAKSGAICTVQDNGGQVQITNAAMTDYNYDGLMDVALSFRLPKDKNTYMWMCLGNTDIFDSGEKLPQALTDQALVLDIDGNFIPDFFVSSATETGNAGRGFLVREGANGTYRFEPQLGANNPLRRFHSSAFADFDSDCLADLFVTSTNGGGVRGEIWRNSQNGFASTYSEVVFPSGISTADFGQFSFADMDADGAVDIVVPICSGRNCASSSIMVMYNKRSGAADQYCVPSENFGFGPEFTTMAALPSGMQFVPLSDTDSEYNPPIVLHTGDYNLDGYPDVLAVVVVGGERKAILLTNMPCDDGVQSCHVRTLAYTPLPPLESIANPVTAAFFDYEENIMLDVMVLTATQASKGLPAFGMRVLKNTGASATDAFFLKTTVLNGKCMEWCTDGQKFPDPEPLGVNAVGPTVLLAFSDLNGREVVRWGSMATSIARLFLGQRAQFTQTCHNSLQTPYVVFGLGRTTNYVDKLFATVPYTANKAINRNMFQSVIPNAQVVIVPYEPQKPEDWAIQLFLIPSHVTLWVAIATVAMCSVLTMIVIGLHVKEKYEDEAEKRRREHLFNYNAM